MITFTNVRFPALGDQELKRTARTNELRHLERQLGPWNYNDDPVEIVHDIHSLRPQANVTVGDVTKYLTARQMRRTILHWASIAVACVCLVVVGQFLYSLHTRVVELESRTTFLEEFKITELDPLWEQIFQTDENVKNYRRDFEKTLEKNGYTLTYLRNVTNRHDDTISDLRDKINSIADEKK